MAKNLIGGPVEKESHSRLRKQHLQWHSGKKLFMYVCHLVTMECDGQMKVGYKMGLDRFSGFRFLTISTWFLNIYVFIFAMHQTLLFYKY